MEKILKNILSSIEWRCLSYKAEYQGLRIRSHFLWVFRRTSTIPYKVLNINRCIIMMGQGGNDYLCSVFSDNLKNITMYRSLSENEVKSYSGQLIKDIRLKYQGDLSIN